jgi:hypothetical protein
MRTLLLSITLLLTLQASDCATAGSIQDSKVTKAKREADKNCPRHFDHRFFDPHHHNDARAKLGLPPTEYSAGVIANEEEAYRKCMMEETEAEAQPAPWPAPEGGTQH